MTDQANSHHALTPHESLLLLESSSDAGLTKHQAAERLKTFGPNELPPARRAGPVMRFLRQLNNPLIYVLLVAGGLTAALGHVVDSAVIFGVVIVNAVIGYIQESRAEAALDALRALVRTDARVVRDGAAMVLPSAQVVPGDVVIVEAGDKVPCDLRLIEVQELRIDESAMTGESRPVVKSEAALDVMTVVADRLNMAYSGTLVVGGSGRGLAVATGAETELGEIHRLVGSADEIATPLTRKLATFARILTVLILALAAATFLVGIVRGESTAEMVTAAVALAVGAIPEGLPAAVTITLAIGVARMARRGAVIRRMPAVEALGGTTVICSDKTGTLTENEMTVRQVWAGGERAVITGEGYDIDGRLAAFTGSDGSPGEAVEVAPRSALRQTLLAGALCNDASLREEADHQWVITGDPTEAALLVSAAKGGVSASELDAMTRLATIPFSSERRLMATCHESADGNLNFFVKGAVERVVELCREQLDAGGATETLDRSVIFEAAEDMARDGMRVLAFATGSMPAVDGEPGLDLDAALQGRTAFFCGLQGMFDPPRRGAIAAVDACRRAGVEVKMITGDHAKTATAIASRLGIAPLDTGAHPEALTGEKIDSLEPADFDRTVSATSVLARVTPAQKLALVESLQRQGGVVAVTGDGVNDAPALKQADVGVAMGRGGTEVAKEAADIVLTDDNFATIEAAVEEGRGIFDNLTKFIAWTIPTNLGEGLVILAAIAAGAVLPILPVQILWINMTTAVALGLMLAFEPKEPGIMRRTPRDPHQQLLTRPIVVRGVLVGLVLVAGSWFMFEWEQRTGASVEEARTAAINLFVAVEAAYLLSSRSVTKSLREIGFFTNRWVLGGLVIQGVLQLALTYLPFMNTLFHTAPIPIGAWMRIAVFAGVAHAIVALDKFRSRQSENRASRVAEYG